MMIEDKSIILCSIVRDSAKGLVRNIPVIKSLTKYFKDYKVVVFENDSKDDTKNILSEWMEEDKDHVFILMEDRHLEPTIPSAKSVKCNPFFSKKRISRMVDLRNQYLDIIEKNRWEADYLIVVDLDVSLINLNGILNSFRHDIDWDAVTAFGYSLSPKLKRRYHDTYALTEFGDEDTPQTEKKINTLSYKYGKLKGSDDWVRVFSAFGGLAIFRFAAVKGLRYKIIFNHDARVEVRCEHFSIYQQMKERGFDRVYINPAMTLKYQKLTWAIILNYLNRTLRIKL